MSPSRLEIALFLTATLLAAVVSWGLLLRPSIDPDPARFDALPRTLMGWQSIDVEIDQAVSDMLAADHNVQRAYVHPQGYVVFAYLGYYGTERGGTPEHTPDVCYPAQGWEVLSETSRRVGGSGGIDVREFVVESGGERRLVYFWYRATHASGITSTAELRLQHFWGRLVNNRGDGALVRLSTRIEGDDVESARGRMVGFVSAVESAVATVWDAPPSLARVEAQPSRP